jgi:hypothetical protein
MDQLKLGKSCASAWDQLSDIDRSIFERLPTDYRDFLDRSNGGFVAPESPSSFSVPIERRRDGKIVSICEQKRVEEFFSVIPSEKKYKRRYGESPASLFHEHWGRYVDEEFLPDDVVVFASCNQGCLLAISLNPDDYGAIYYWEWYWQYPWFSEFFNERIQAAQSTYADIEEVLGDPTHPKHREAFNVSNYATLLKVADCFTAFVQSLKHENCADA